ncbi:MAG TPA: SigB/SigF/SigG family RNA polymerase sigma factor [Solirubrobacteraceae bacterium]|nr:SigB/SigF/SigG family RNA polymerase sigma factor [Solirubrobacteraceae bacterium]
MAAVQVESGELFSRWRRLGAQQDRDQLIERFMPLARKLARRYAGTREPFDDLMQVAYLGLVKAVDRFDPDRGAAFSSFAVPTIVGELRRYFRDLGWAAHVPRGAQEMALMVERARTAYATQHGVGPTVEELADELGWSIEDVLTGIEAGAAQHSVSLDAPCERDEERATLVDTVGTLDLGLEAVETRLSIVNAARNLTARERRVLVLRFVDDRTQTQIADQIGVSQMQVSRILSRAVTRLGELMTQQQAGAVDGARL